MQYDPIKNRINAMITYSASFRRFFFWLLDMLLLRQSYIKRAISKYFKRDEDFRFYDAGAGFCQYSYHILKRYSHARVFATDLKKDYLQKFAGFARAYFGDRFYYQEADLQVFVPKLHYDLVLAIDILEHIEDDRAVLKNFYSCMNPGAKLIISTPSDLDEAAKFTAEHVRPGYNKQELEDKLNDAGFILRESSYSYGKYGALAWRLLMKYPLQMLAQSKLALAIIPIYYLFVYPVAFVLNKLDLANHNAQGTGLFVVAEKA